jgi:hypothetical protein
MKCRMGFTNRMTRVFTASPHSLVHLCATYLFFAEVKSCYVTSVRDDDPTEVDWYLLWRKDNGGVPIYTENLPVALTSFKHCVISEFGQLHLTHEREYLRKKLLANADETTKPWVDAML